MLTKNFYLHMRATMQNVTVNFTTVDGSTTSNNPTQLMNTSCLQPFIAMAVYTSSATARGVSFGTGTTPPKVTDYCLENPITSGLTVTSPSVAAYNQTDEYGEYTVTFGVTAANTVTITEIGLKCNSYFYSKDDQKVVMVDRTVLDAPVTIPAGQSKQITYTIRFNY